ncbi:hypothetical protein BGX28_004019, partial [Mortierella sp. GBA30]
PLMPSLTTVLAYMDDVAHYPSLCIEREKKDGGREKCLDQQQLIILRKMNQIDQSLDDMIKRQREVKKKLTVKGKGYASAAQSVKSTKIPKQAPGGVQIRGIRTQRAIRAANAKSPYARPSIVKKETALFTESYKAATAPVKEIFTAGYIPKPTTTLKLFTTNNKAGISTGRQLADTAKPLSVGPLRLVTTQKPKREAAPAKNPVTTAIPTAPASFSTRNDRDRATSSARNQGPSAQSGGGRGADSYRPNSDSSVERHYDRNYGRNFDRISDRNFDRGSDRMNDRGSDRSFDRGNLSNKFGDRRVNDDYADIRSGSGSSMQPNVRGNLNNSNYNSNINSNIISSNNNSSVNNNIQRRANDSRAPTQALLQEGRLQPTNRPLEMSASSMDMDMDISQDDSMISIKGSAPGSSVAFRGESGPVTVEIENLDPGTTSEDVKYVCSRFGEILSCVCSHGFSQVTYARKVAGQAAVDNLHGKKADNGKVLRVTMLKNPVMHEEFTSPQVHVPTPIAGPMKILSKAVHGTIANAGTIYSDHLLAAQTMLKVQQHRMAQLHQEEERIKALRLQTSSQQGQFSTPSRGYF